MNYGKIRRRKTMGRIAVDGIEGAPDDTKCD